MDITNALLVAMMFIVLLTIGISNIVVALASLLDKRSPVKPDGYHTNWVVMLLLLHLNLFWHVLDILNVESWVFPEFLYVVLGAILIFFATHILLPDASSDATDLRTHYFDVRRQFFSLLALLMVWNVGVDFLLGNGWTSASTLNLAGLVIFAVMALTSRPRVHAIGMGIAWLFFVVALGAQGTGVVH